jgi:hypothetical protein
MSRSPGEPSRQQFLVNGDQYSDEGEEDYDEGEEDYNSEDQEREEGVEAVSPDKHKFLVNGSYAKDGNESDEADDAEEGPDGYEDEEERERPHAQQAPPDSQPPPMPESFYSNLDQFLSRPPPKVANFGEKTKQSGVKDSSVVLPVLNNPKQKKAVTSKVKSKLHDSRTLDNDMERRFDPTLLQEAFAYVDKIQREVVGDGDDGGDAVEHQDEVRRIPQKAGSAPQLSRPTEAHKPQSNNNNNNKQNHPYLRQEAMRSKTKKSSKQNKEGVVRRLRSQTNITATEDNAFSNMSTNIDTSKRGAVDMASLVSNFENGILLNQLKAELEASKKSMAESENFMMKLSKEYSKKKR